MFAITTWRDIIGSVRRLEADPLTDEGQVREVLRAAYGVPRPRPIDRPWVGVCMVASLDGSTVVDRRSAALSSDVDREVLATLRSLADVIVVGAGTARTERYGPPKRAGQRIGIVSRTGAMDVTLPLFTSGAGFLILPEDGPEVKVEAIRCGVGEIDLVGVMRQMAVGFVHVEGGPSLNGALASADLIDELNLTLSPQVVGGNGPRVTSGAESITRPMRVAHVLESDGFLFTRYVRSDAEGGQGSGE
jgi:riboflavin biosynthesis pyrimidine reductase